MTILKGHIEAYNIIRDSQHDFRRGWSCLTNLLYFYEDMHDKINNKKQTKLNSHRING